jgi:hypothetical protein
VRAAAPVGYSPDGSVALPDGSAPAGSAEPQADGCSPAGWAEQLVDGSAPAGSAEPQADDCFPAGWVERLAADLVLVGSAAPRADVPEPLSAVLARGGCSVEPRADDSPDDSLERPVADSPAASPPEPVQVVPDVPPAVPAFPPEPVQAAPVLPPQVVLGDLLPVDRAWPAVVPASPRLRVDGQFLVEPVSLRARLSQPDAPLPLDASSRAPSSEAVVPDAPP